MAPPEAQLAWFTTALDELKPFLQSDDVFRPLHHAPAGMRQDLSLGLLLLTADSLSARAEELSEADRAVLAEADRRWEAERVSQASAVARKAEAELRSRINLWRAYVQDLEEKPKEAASYAVEVRHRAIVERLQEVLGGRTEDRLRHRLAELDSRLRGSWTPGPFVWDPALEGRYPRSAYWFLYGRVS